MAKLSIISKLFPSCKWKVAALVVGGVVLGGGGLFMYLLRAHTYPESPVSAWLEKAKAKGRLALK